MYHSLVYLNAFEARRTDNKSLFNINRVIFDIFNFCLVLYRCIRVAFLIELTSLPIDLTSRREHLNILFSLRVYRVPDRS